MISGIRNSTASKSPIISVVTPIISDYQLVGHITLDIEMNEFLEEEFTLLNEDNPGEYFLLDETGSVIKKHVYYKSFDSHSFSDEFSNQIDKIISGNTLIEENNKGIEQITISRRVNISEENIEEVIYIAYMAEKGKVIHEYLTVAEFMGILVFIFLVTFIRIIKTKTPE